MARGRQAEITEAGLTIHHGFGSSYLIRDHTVDLTVRINHFNSDIQISNFNLRTPIKACLLSQKAGRPFVLPFRLIQH